MNTTLQAYLRGLEALSGVKKKIIRRLWGSNKKPFPKDWIRSSELLRLTGQKYFDRRIRELRDELGCDIETAPQEGEHSYRLRTSNRTASKPRGYLATSKKRALFEKFKFSCQICGKVETGGVRGLQADHKIPLQRGGKNSEENWQPICNECNVGKRGACEGCEAECKRCPWAFPESVGRVTLLRLPPSVLEALGKRSGGDQKKLEKNVIEILKKDLEIG